MSTVPVARTQTVDGSSIPMLLLANVITIVLALIFSWPLSTLLWPYWIQSVVIGYFAQKRIRLLHEFSTEGFKVNDEQPPPTEDTKRKTANFFLLHYGFFHVFYFFFMLSTLRTLTRYDVIGIGVATISFVANHRASFRRNIEADLVGKPNIGTLMFLPYLRIMPMHITIIIGAAAEFQGPLPVLLFGALKTTFDVLMHKAEHYILQRSGGSQ